MPWVPLRMGCNIPSPLGRSRLVGNLGSSLGGLSSGLSGSSLRLLGSLSRGISGWGLGDGGSGDLSDSLLGGLSLLGSLGLLDLLGLGLLLVLAATEQRAKDGSTLLAGRSLALVSLDLLGSLLLGLLLGSLGGSLGGGGRGGVSIGSGGLLNSLGRLLGLLLLGLLFLLGNDRREGGESGLVLLRLDDGLGELLGLGNLELELRDPVVTVGGGRGLEGMLVALGAQDELVGAIGGGLRSIGLGFEVSIP